MLKSLAKIIKAIFVCKTFFAKTSNAIDIEHEEQIQHSEQEAEQKNPKNSKIIYTKLEKPNTDEIIDLLLYELEKGSSITEIRKKFTLIPITEDSYLVLQYTKSEEKIVPILILTNQMGCYIQCSSYSILNKINHNIDYKYHLRYRRLIESECKKMHKEIKQSLTDIVNDAVIMIKGEITNDKSTIS